MSNVILHSGGYRTGSTVCFNIVRLLYKLKDIKHDSRQYALDELRPRSKHARDVMFNIKIHHHMPKEPWKVICTYRNPYDVAASLYARHLSTNENATKHNFGCANVIESMHAQTQHLRKMLDHKNSLLIAYPDILDMRTAISKIAEYLNIDYSYGIRQAILEELNIDKVFNDMGKEDAKEADPVTQFRKHHVSHLTKGQSHGYKHLSLDLQEALEKNFGPYDKWCLDNI